MVTDEKGEVWIYDAELADPIVKIAAVDKTQALQIAADYLLEVQADAERTLGAARTAGREQALAEVEEAFAEALDVLVPFEEDEDTTPEQVNAIKRLTTLRGVIRSRLGASA